jgi:hypothetical protein
MARPANARALGMVHLVFVVPRDADNRKLIVHGCAGRLWTLNKSGLPRVLLQSCR